ISAAWPAEGRCAMAIAMAIKKAVTTTERTTVMTLTTVTALSTSARRSGIAKNPDVIGAFPPNSDDRIVHRIEDDAVPMDFQVGRRIWRKREIPCFPPRRFLVRVIHEDAAAPIAVVDQYLGGRVPYAIALVTDDR